MTALPLKHFLSASDFDQTLSFKVPILAQLLHWATRDIRGLFESYGLTLNEWEKERMDRVKIGEILSHADRVRAGAA